MDKKLIVGIAIVLIVGLAVAGYFYWQKSKSPSRSVLDKAGEATQKLTESATQGVLPSIETNPLENKPDINPADKANPYKDAITNPFK